MLKVQQLLKTGTTLTQLQEKYGITHNEHEDGRIILNYCQIESPKLDPIVRECRGLVLGPQFQLVAKSFDRFFNLGEDLESQKDFDWDYFVCDEKVDGSLCIAHSYEGKFYINTRNSFAEGKINDSHYTWKELVLSVLPQKVINYILENPGVSLVFELCSPYNKVVRQYNTTILYLLAAFKGEQELSPFGLKHVAKQLELETPKQHLLRSKDDVLDLIQKLEKDDPTNEGVVLRDRNNLRIKVKTKTWYALSALKDNGNLFSHRRLIPLILKNEHEEALCYFPELRSKVNPLVEFISKSLVDIGLAWEQVKNIGPQKDFALAVLPYWYSSILFKARKLGVSPTTMVQEFSDLFIKKWECKSAG